VESIPFDLARNGAGQRLADDLTSRGLKINLLINNAGFGDQGRFLQLPLERQLQAINLQNATVVELTHRLLPEMIEQKQGGIITISSMAGFQPIPFASVYSATKAFLTTFSLALEAEMSRFGVRVVTVCPDGCKWRTKMSKTAATESSLSPLRDTLAKLGVPRQRARERGC